jgi:hypothetical protein
MKPFLIALLFCLFTLGCAERKAAEPAAEAALSGALDGSTYRNDFFAFTLTLPEGWEVVPEDERAALAEKLKAAHAQRLEVHLMLQRPAEKASIPDVFIVAAVPYPNPTFNPVDDATTFFQSGPGEGSEVLRRASPADVGGVRFVREDLLHRGAGQYMAHHAMVVRGHLLSLQAYSATRRRMEEVAREMGDAIRFTR